MIRNRSRSVASVVVLGLLVTGLVSAAVPAFGSGLEAQVTLSPPAGQEAAKHGDSMPVGGTTSAATLVRAVLHFRDAAGGPAADDIDVLNRVSLVDGHFQGTGGIPGPNWVPREANDGSAILEVTVRGAGEEPEEATVYSNPVVLDFVQPHIASTALVAPKTVEVRFSESVWLDGSVQDLLLDWRVDDNPPISVEGAGSVRRLSVASELDEDATPRVQYWPQANSGYRDRAKHPFGLENLNSTAVDKILPKVPSIEQIAGLPSTDTVVSNDVTPEVKVGTIREGHVAEVYLEADGSGSLSEGDPMVGEATAGADGALVTTEDLGTDDTHKLYAVARDPHENRSGADTGSYRLDTVLPVALYGVAEDGGVTMRFSENIFGADDPSRWSIQHNGLIYPVGGVGGSGDTRVLQANVPAGANVTYTPGAYTDKAGNGLETFSLDARDGIPPLVQIDDPTSTVYTAADTYTIQGSSEGGALVEVLADGESAPVASERLPEGDGAFSFEVPLQPNASNGFTLRATDAAGNESGGYRTPDIVNDQTSPAVALQAPGGGEVLQGDAITVVRWNAQDANFGPGAIRILYSADSGLTWTTVAGAESNDGRYNWHVPAVSTEAGMLRIEATDRMGLSASDDSGLFRVDAVAPRFEATTVDATHLKIRFSEPVTGASGSDEWWINGVPSASISTQGTDDVLVEVAPALAFKANDRPLVDYKPQDLPGRQVYRDAAGNMVPEAARSVEAKDGIAPAAPQLESVEGRSASAPVLANDATPEVRLTGLGQGDTAVVFVEADDAAGLTEGDPQVGERPAAADGTAVIETAALGSDGDYTLYAASRDPNANRSAADSVVYSLDTVVPVALYARTDGIDILVGFSEPVTGANAAAQWAIGDGLYQVNGVSGSGDSRLLDAPNVPQDTMAAWTPPASEAYADAAGNAVAAFGLRTLDQIPPLVTITSPGSNTWVASDTFELRGIATKSDAVEVYADAGNDGQPNGGPLATLTPGSGGAISVTLPLTSGAANDFVVRGIRPSKGLVGPYVNVPTIVQDAADPTAAITAPAAGDMLAGRRKYQITWNAADTNFGLAPIAIEASLDGGATWDVVAGATENDGSHEWTTPGISTSSARIRLTASDLAGRSVRVATGSFTIDADPPAFEAKTLDAHHVGVTFTEAVDGSVDLASSVEWWVAGTPVARVWQTQGPDGRTALMLETRDDRPIGPNDRPSVTYAPFSIFGREAFHDAAGNVVAERDVIAADGIVPAAPSLIKFAGGPTRSGSAALAGSAVPEAGSIVVAKRLAPSSATWSAPLGADGSFGVTVGLAKNASNRFSIQVRDPNGNLSEARTAVVEQDSLKPRVKVKSLQQRAAGRRLVLRIRWLSQDLFPGTADLSYELAGSRRTRAIASRTADDGELTWRVPRSLRGRSVRIIIRATDQAGNVGRTTSRWLRLR